MEYNPSDNDEVLGEDELDGERSCDEEGYVQPERHGQGGAAGGGVPPGGVPADPGRCARAARHDGRLRPACLGLDQAY